MTFQEVFLEPLPDMTALLSGTLGIGPDRDGLSAISGVIKVDSAEFKRTVTLGEILKSTARTLFSRNRGIGGAALPNMAELPPLPIDIKVTAPGNILVETTWGAGELKGDLTVRGTLRDPQPEGQIGVISGWVGLRDRRFEITNGSITLTPPSLDPALDVLAETTIRSRQGDLVLVLLEVKGNSSAPRLKLSSDRGLTEREILTLFTAPGDSTISSRVSTMSGGIEVDAFEFIEDRSFLGLGRLVRDLARIDSLSLEPTFNTQRGVVEPTLTATKRLFDHLSVVGETPLSGGQSNSRLRLIYDFTPAVEVSGIIDTLSRDKNTSVGFDIGYTLLGERRRFLDIRISGNRMFRAADIETAIRLNQDSRITENDLARLEAKVQGFYREQGYFHTSVHATCEKVPGFSDSFCHQLRLTLEEERPSYITSVVFKGDALPQAVLSQNLERRSLKNVASEAIRKDFELALMRRLRAEGYISARVEASLRALTDTSSKYEQELVAEITVGNPVTFVFSGNTIFSPADFLETINLFGRKQPFGNNTISILLRNIVRRYNERGYLLATTSFTRARDDQTGRVTFHIEISEGKLFRVDRVELKGLRSIEESELRQILERSDAKAAKLIFSPDFAVEDQLQVNTATLTRALVEMGFPNAQVSVETSPDSNTSTVAIIYSVEEGARELAHAIRIQGSPAEVLLPPLPPFPAAIPEVNKYTQELSRALSESGYQSASIEASLPDEEGAIQLTVVPGTQQTISTINIEGNSAIEAATIYAELLLSPGSPLREDLIQESKRRLLRLGVFNRVDVSLEPDEATAHSSRLSIRVQERSLRTLSLGGGANSELGLHLFGEATDRSLFRDGRSFTARLDTYYDRVATSISQGIASLTYADPSLSGSDFGFVSDLRFQRLDLSTQEFNLDRVALANYVHRSWESGSTISLGHTLLSENLDNVSPGAIVGPFDTGTVRLSFLSSVLTLDRRDDPLNPTRGYTASLDSLLATESLGSEANYGGSTARFSFLAPLEPLSPRWSFAANARTGALWTFGGTDVVPISQRFYLGGRNSVRGFRENTLGPRGSDGAVQGGDFFVSQSLELRYLLSESTSLIGFLDMGGLYFLDESIRADDLRESTGMGFRYLSPIGPVGFDLGVPLDERSGEPSFRIHFNIGTNF
jgi:outer membrane protein insertion porin family